MALKKVCHLKAYPSQPVLMRHNLENTHPTSSSLIALLSLWLLPFRLYFHKEVRILLLKKTKISKLSKRTDHDETEKKLDDYGLLYD